MRSVPLSVNVRRTVFRRLLIAFCISVVAQAGAYVLFCALLVSLAEVFPAGSLVAANIVVLALPIAIALPLGFFGARLSYRAMRSRVPAHRRLPIQPAIIAAAIAACLSIVIDWAIRPEIATLGRVTRDIIAAGLWIYAARRSFVRNA